MDVSMAWYQDLLSTTISEIVDRLKHIESEKLCVSINLYANDKKWATHLIKLPIYITHNGLTLHLRNFYLILKSQTGLGWISEVDHLSGMCKALGLTHCTAIWRKKPKSSMELFYTHTAQKGEYKCHIT
jgi:hypothetical protein